MGRPNLWQRLGPGILLAATSIGASHLVLAPQAGARFGFELWWLVLLAHLVKYPAFEFGPRYAAATGQSLLSGYARMPGPRGCALWLFLSSAALAVVTLFWVSNPVRLVPAVALVSLAVAPVLYALNLLCVQRHIREPRLRPARLTLILGWIGVAVMLVAVGMTA